MSRIQSYNLGWISTKTLCILAVHRNASKASRYFPGLGCNLVILIFTFRIFSNKVRGGNMHFFIALDEKEQCTEASVEELRLWTRETRQESSKKKMTEEVDYKVSRNCRWNWEYMAIKVWKYTAHHLSENNSRLVRLVMEILAAMQRCSPKVSIGWRHWVTCSVFFQNLWLKL